MDVYEITYACVDEDWLSSRIEACDFHDACERALTRLALAASDNYAGSKLDGARLLRIERLP